MCAGGGGVGGGGNFRDILFAFSVHHVPSVKGSSLKGKNLLPANSFLLEKTLFKREAK